MIDHPRLAKLTHEAICDPLPGDRFTEMFAYWMEVEDVLWSQKTENKIVVFRNLGTDAVEKLPLDEYVKKFHYNSPTMKEKCWLDITHRAGTKIDWNTAQTSQKKES